MNYIYVHEGSLPSYIVKSLENKSATAVRLNSQLQEVEERTREQEARFANKSIEIEHNQ